MRVSAVSASTYNLVVGEEPGPEFQKTKSLGVKTVTYRELIKMFEQRNRNPRLF